jgi:hypothetical protein
MHNKSGKKWDLDVKGAIEMCENATWMCKGGTGI